jgi:hypothetical protein
MLDNMNKRPLLLINGRWTRLDEVISLYRKADADDSTPARGGITDARNGKPSMVHRAAGLIEVSARRSGRQLLKVNTNE